jgi:hypothetical protein
VTTSSTNPQDEHNPQGSPKPEPAPTEIPDIKFDTIFKGHPPPEETPDA